MSADLADALRAAYAPAASGTGGGLDSGAGGDDRGPVASGDGGAGAGASAGGAGSGGSAGGLNAGVAGSAGADGSAGSAGSAGATNTCDGFAILAANCTTGGCHGEGSNLEDFAASESRARAFIGKPGTLACTGQGNVIDVDNPAQSLMVRKLSDDPPCGDTMPVLGEPLSASEIDCIESWIGGL